MSHCLFKMRHGLISIDNFLKQEIYLPKVKIESKTNNNDNDNSADDDDDDEDDDDYYDDYNDKMMMMMMGIVAHW